MNFEGFQMQKRSIPPDRAQREDDNMVQFFWHVCCHYRVAVNKMTQIAFCADGSKK